MWQELFKGFFSIYLIFFVSFAHGSSWAEDLLNQMTVTEKIGQLFVIPVCPLRNDYHVDQVISLIKEYGIGGVLPKMATYRTQEAMVLKLRSFAKVPFLVFQDAEWGASMRIIDALPLPKNYELEEITDQEVFYSLGVQIANQCKKALVDVVLAPVVDVIVDNTAPTLKKRCFGEDPEMVALKGYYVAKGIEDSGLAACGKHFPGHGEAFIDSHYELPLIPLTMPALNKKALVPFRKLIQENIACIMSAHLFIPVLSNYPASLSYSIIQDLLINKMNYKGIIITDALNMKALMNHFTVSEISVMAFKAGNHFLLYGEHISEKVDELLFQIIPEAMDAIYQAVLSGEISMEELDLRVLRILQFKQKFQIIHS